MNKRDAVLTGIRAASELHERLGLRDRLIRSREGVDIFGVIHEMELPLLFRPLRDLLGAYIVRGEDKGILVTTNRRLPVQRFTAAHELGHHFLGHAESHDDDKTIQLARDISDVSPMQEVEAEAFAAEFLLPKWLVYSVVKNQNWSLSDLTSPDIVYQLSLRLGTSYKATCFALNSHNFVRHQDLVALGTIQPKTLKNKVLQHLSSGEPHADAFSLNANDSGCHIHAGPEDTIVINLPEHSTSGYCWVVDSQPGSRIELLDYTITRPKGDKEKVEFGKITNRRIAFRSKSQINLKLRESRKWESKEPINTFEVSIDFFGKEVGLPRVAR